MAFLFWEGLGSGFRTFGFIGLWHGRGFSGSVFQVKTHYKALYEGHVRGLQTPGYVGPTWRFRVLSSPIISVVITHL